MIRLLKNFFIKNLKVKILCLILAVLLWVFVASNQSLLGKFPSQIKVNPVNLSDQYYSFLDQESVQVSIMAEPGAWRSLTADSFTASVDLAGLKEGTYELNVRVASNVSDIQITKIEPAKIFVTVEKIASKSVTLSPKIDGDPADGMVLGAIALEPETVEVRGPSSYLETISEVNAVINLNGESESFERDSVVSALTDNSFEKGVVTFSPSTVRARVTISKGGNNKTVGVKVKTKGSPRDSFYVSNISVSPATVDIVGQRSVLANINYIETEDIEITNQSEAISREANLILPEGVNLQKGIAQRVKVEISFALMGGSKSISPVVSATGLAEGLRLLTYSPSEVKVSLGGPQNLLAALSTNDVRLELNLSGKSAGSYNIDINTSMLRLPEGVLATSLTPQSLSIVIGN